MENISQVVIGYLVTIIEACGAVVIVLGVGRAMVGYVRAFFSPDCARRIAPLRLQLGQTMVMALEFQVAADILKTALSPTWNDILFLAALVALRTVLNYVLELELRHLSLETRAGASSDASLESQG